MISPYVFQIRAQQDKHVDLLCRRKDGKVWCKLAIAVPRQQVDRPIPSPYYPFEFTSVNELREVYGDDFQPVMACYAYGYLGEHGHTFFQAR